MVKVLRARGKMLRNKAVGPADCPVTERLRCLPTETVNEVACCFDKRFKGECWAPDAWKVLRLVLLKEPDANLEKGLRGFRAIALLSVFSMWYTTVLVDLLHTRNRSPLSGGICTWEPRQVSTVKTCRRW